MAKAKMPNWAQMQIQKGAGLGPLELIVVMDDEVRVVFQCLSTRDQYIVEKRDGSVRYNKQESRVMRNGNQRKRPAEGHEGFL